MLKPSLSSLFFLSLCFFFSCNNQKKEETSKNTFKEKETGLKYNFYKDKKGKNAKPGQVLLLDFILMDNKDSVLNQKQNHDIKLGPSRYPGSLSEALSMMSEGDSAAFKIVADSFFTKTVQQPIPSFIDSGSYLTYRIKLNKIYENDSAFQKAKQNKIKKQINPEEKGKNTKSSINSPEKKKAIKEIREYLKENNLSFNKTESGLFYKIHKKGKGKKVQKGDYVKFHYRGKLISGKEFQSTYKKDEPFECLIGGGQIIEALDKGIQLLHEGAKATFITPPFLAYGEDAQGTLIPGNATLIFEVKLLKVSENKI